MDRFYDFVGVNFWDALFILLNTLIIFFVAKKFLFKPVMKIIHERQQEIDDLYTKANHAKEQAGVLRNEYEKKLEAASSEAERLVKEATVRGQNREEEILRHAKAEASAILDKAAADIAQEKKKAINDAKDELSEMAVAIAEKVVARELNAQDQEALVDHFIDELGDSV